MVSAQKIELASVRGQVLDSVVAWLNRHDLHWSLAAPKSGLNPTKCGAECATSYRHQVLVATKIADKGGDDLFYAPTPPPAPCCDTNINVVNVVNNITVIDTDTCCNQTPAPKKPIMAEAQIVWFGEVNGLFPTNRSYATLTPAIELGFEVSGRLENHPGISVFFESNIVAIPAAFIKQETCPSCVPQVQKATIGAQLGTGITWQVGKKLSLTGYRASKVWLPFEREVKAIPGNGWGCRLTFGKPNATVKWQIGTATSREAGTAPYFGLRVDFGGKKNSRVLFQPAKLTRA